MNVSELLEVAEKYRNVRYDRVFDLAQMNVSYAEYIRNIQGNKVSTGIGSFDRALGLVRPSQVVSILGGTNVGKTAIAMNCVYDNSRLLQKKIALMFNLEIDENEFYERSLQMEFDLSTYDVENAFLSGDMHRLKEFEQIYEKYKNVICVIGRVDINDILPYTMAIEEMMQMPVGMVILDHLGLIKNSEFTDPYLRVTDNMMKLKEFALSTKKTFIDLSQVGRAELKSDKGINLYSGKESGEIENSSQIVISLNKLTHDKAFSLAVPQKYIDMANNKEIYLILAKIEKKKQGDYAETVLIQNRKNLRITEIENLLTDPF